MVWRTWARWSARVKRTVSWAVKALVEATPISVFEESGCNPENQPTNGNHKRCVMVVVARGGIVLSRGMWFV
jgi:hypothetical protein